MCACKDCICVLNILPSVYIVCVLRDGADYVCIYIYLYCFACLNIVVCLSHLSALPGSHWEHIREAGLFYLGERESTHRKIQALLFILRTCSCGSTLTPTPPIAPLNSRVRWCAQANPRWTGRCSSCLSSVECCTQLHYFLSWWKEELPGPRDDLVPSSYLCPRFKNCLACERWSSVQFGLWGICQVSEPGIVAVIGF